MKKNTGLTVLMLFCTILFSFSQDNNVARMTWHNNKFSMFIHFGVYSELGGVWQGNPVTRGYSEQIQAHAGIMTDIYDEVPDQFNPAKWNADGIASLAKKAGMRSIVITSKHHDGFCMYHSAYTRFNIVDASPFKRDVIGELSAACKKAGLKFGLYYSLIDYRIHPFASHNANPISDDHHEYNKKQVTELLNNYGPISEMWFDMGSLTSKQSHEIYELVHRLQPDCLVSGRLGNDAYDFCVMGDNEYPDFKIDAPWQTPASMFDETWGYRSWQKRENAPAKTREKLLSLLKVVSRGGNYLLNIGPKGDGAVVQYEAEVLTGIGQWLDKNGEAIYGTNANPLPSACSWGEITTRDNSLYLILSGKKSASLELPGISGKVRQASLLLDPGTRFNSRNKSGILTISIPESLYDKPDIQVIKLEFEKAYRLAPAQLVSGKNPALNFSNAIKHYSYSCIDYYNNHRSVVRQTWNVDMKKQSDHPRILFTAGELGKEVELRWNGEKQLIRFIDTEKLPDQTVPGTIHWGERHRFGPVDSDFEGNPGPVIPGTDPLTSWNRRPERQWQPQAEWNDGAEEHLVSKPIQQEFVLQEISSERDQYQLTEICSGDGIQVWLNGENLVNHNNPRGSRMNKEIVLLPLKQGKNQLLIKFYNRYGYDLGYRINSKIDQTIYSQEINPLNFRGITNCELRLAQPVSAHQPLRMNNIRIKL